MRLLLRIKRNQTLQLAEVTVNMALLRKNKQKCPYIVGIDFSGNSERLNSDLNRFEQLLKRARAGGLMITVHFAEHFDDDEATRVLAFRPNRVGHAFCLPESLYTKMLERGIPIEYVCYLECVHDGKKPPR